MVALCHSTAKVSTKSLDEEQTKSLDEEQTQSLLDRTSRCLSVSTGPAPGSDNLFQLPCHDLGGWAAGSQACAMTLNPVHSPIQRLHACDIRIINRLGPSYLGVSIGS